MDAAVGNPLRARLEQLDARASAQRFFDLPTSARTRSPGRPPATKTTKPVGAGDAAPALGERVDAELELVSAAGSVPARRRAQASALSILSRMLLRPLPFFSCVRTLRSSGLLRSPSRCPIWAAVSSS